MIVKVCGMRDVENIRQIESLGIDWMGFIFYEKSKRHVATKPQYLPSKAKRIGVFVDYSIDEVVKKADEFQFDGIQLHGSETPDYCRELRKALKASLKRDLLINKAFGISTQAIATTTSSTQKRLPKAEPESPSIGSFCRITKGRPPSF